MTQRKFTVIKGGADNIPSQDNMTFISAFVTDTRLMGVLGLYIRWEINKTNNPTPLHQFFYYDAEEYGLETYRSLMGGDEPELTLLEQSLIGGLGGSKVDLSEIEARYLVQHFVAASKNMNIPIAEPKEEYAFLLENPVALTQKQIDTVMDKTCTPLLSHNHLIHYFLMRCFALDQEAVGFLSLLEFSLTEMCGNSPATLCKNTINQHIDDQGKTSYVCEALIEVDDRYKLLVIELGIADFKINNLIIHSSFFVTATEAAMLLNRTEYITVYEIMADPEIFDEAFLPLTSSSLQTSHNDGRLFLEFNKNNDHVNKQIFRLNEDIHGLFYVSDFGQLLLVSYEIGTIHEMERTLRKGVLSSMLIITARYEFKEPILYEFLQSDFEDFADFVSALQD